MKKILLASLLLLSACTSAPDARKALDDLGFDDIQPGGYSWFGCGEDYAFHTKFTAKNPKGKPVTGVACSGWLKGTSIKFD